MPNCYYYDEQRNHCNCYVNENLNELLAENARLREQVDAAHMSRLLTENENEQLRELCATVIDDWMSKVCPTFPFCECGGEYQDCIDETCGNQIYRQMARELVGWAHEHD